MGVVRAGLMKDGRRNDAVAVGICTRRIEGINRCRSMGAAIVKW